MTDNVVRCPYCGWVLSANCCLEGRKLMETKREAKTEKRYTVIKAKKRS